MSQILHFPGTFKHVPVCFISTERVNGTLHYDSNVLFRTLPLKRNTLRLGFCTFRVLLNTFLFASSPWKE